MTKYILGVIGLLILLAAFLFALTIKPDEGTNPPPPPPQGEIDNSAHATYCQSNNPQVCDGTDSNTVKTEVK